MFTKPAFVIFSSGIHQLASSSVLSLRKDVMTIAWIDAFRRVSRGIRERVSVSGLEIRKGPYVARLVSRHRDILPALRLRFEVFNLELNEGLASAFTYGHDIDEFDAICDHLVVEHVATRRVIGTYRLQTGASACKNFGYYSEREFEFTPYRGLSDELVELGRACIHRDHRSTDVLYLLWRGIAQYAQARGARYLIGCSSLTSQDPAQGTAVYNSLLNWQVDETLRTIPQPQFAMPLTESSSANSAVPKLLRTYLAIGARICGAPAIDRDFKTIDFLMLLDLQELHPRIRARFLDPA